MLSQTSSNAAETPSHRDQESLAAAFEFFNETSEQLSHSYRLLENRVQQLTTELDKVGQEKQLEQRKKTKIAGRMRALLNFLPGGVIVLDANGYVLEANPAAKMLLACELEGELWRNTINKCFAPRNDDGLEVSTHKGRRISIATSSLGNDGQIILLTDQTETRQLQEHLSRHQRLSAMGKMVSALAHQIRTPLSAAMLYAGHLCKGNISDDNRQSFAGKLYGRLQHMEKQVRDMMLFVKSELPLNDVISLSDLKNGLREAAEVALSSSVADCRWTIENGNIRIKCNREALISALMNLINNAIQASAENARLSVKISTFNSNEDTCVRIQISDSGMGMDEKTIEQVQEMFVTTKAQGTGLGLSVVQSVARAHGGQFYLKSSKGKGTQAGIEMPIFNTKEA